MFASVFNCIEINIIPNWLISLDFSSLIPVKGHEILAQAWASGSINHVKSEADRLISSDLKIDIGCVYSVGFLELHKLVDDTT